MSEPDPPDIPEGLEELFKSITGRSDMGAMLAQVLGMVPPGAQVIDVAQVGDSSVPNDWDSVFEPLLDTPREITEREAAINQGVAKRNTLWRTYHEQSVYQVRHLVKHLRAADLPKEVIEGLVLICDQISMIAMIFGRAHLVETLKLSEHLDQVDIESIGVTPFEPVYPGKSPDNNVQALYQTLLEEWYGKQFPVVIDLILPHLDGDDFSDIPCSE